MNNTQTVNDLIAVEPFPKTETLAQVAKSGFVRDNRKGTLVGLKVLVGNLEYPVGTTVHVKSENAIQPWAKEVYDIEGQSAIFMPKSFVLMRTSPPPAPYYTVGTSGGSGFVATTPYPLNVVAPIMERWVQNDNGTWEKVK